MTGIAIVSTIADLRSRIAAARKIGARVGFVPTMGALHEGHLSLVCEAKKRADMVVVSIFVNPMQFGPREDYGRYPRTLEADAAKLAASDADTIFAPSPAEMYPAGFATKVAVGGPALGLETDFRPDFFTGVATIVSKLLLAVMPDVAIFGEKDYQQLMVVKRMTADLGLATEIVGAPIIREADGLAMSSRNAYLSAEERVIAGRMNVILKRLVLYLHASKAIIAAEEEGERALLQAGFAAVDYVAVRDAETLAPISKLDRPTRVLAAAKVGNTRLIDNLAV